MKKKMGRPPLDNVVREEKIFLKVSKQELADIDDIAEYMEIPRSTVIRILTLNSLSDAKIFKKIGLLAVAKGLRKTSEALEEFKKMRTQVIPG